MNGPKIPYARPPSNAPPCLCHVFTYTPSPLFNLHKFTNTTKNYTKNNYKNLVVYLSLRPPWAAGSNDVWPSRFYMHP